MTKSIAAILIATALLLGLSLFEWMFMEREFSDFREEAEILYEKTEREEAEIGDARAVQSAWEARKDRLHVWIPHNDIVRIDDYLSEAVRLIGEKNYPYALVRLEVILHLSECLPGTYRPALENIF